MAAKNSRRTHARTEERQTLKLNLGCGTILLDGFINVDNYQLADTPNFRQADICHLPFATDSADYILADNVLEHLPMHLVPQALFEIYRVLKPAGRCVIIVPDFTNIAEQWIKVSNGRFNPVIWRYFAEIIFGNQLHEGEFHRCPMSPGFINYSLQGAGFRKYSLTIYPQDCKLESDKYPGVAGTGPGEQLRNTMIVADLTK